MEGRYRLGMFVFALAIVLTVANCGTKGKIPGIVTGGGQITAPGTDARFGFNASSCDEEEGPQGVFNFIDKSAASYPGGVHMQGFLRSAELCTKEDGCKSNGFTCPQGSYIIKGDYINKNPKLPRPDGGTVMACVEDTGEGNPAEMPHGIVHGLMAYEGAYHMYSIEEGTVQGNIQAHVCEEEW